MAAPRTCECGRPIRLYTGRTARARRRRRVRGRLRGHDLCQQCWERLKNPARKHSA